MGRVRTRSGRTVVVAIHSTPATGTVRSTLASSHDRAASSQGQIALAIAHCRVTLCATLIEQIVGTEIPRGVIAQIRALTWQCAVGFEWQEGDLLVMDNYTIAHARMCVRPIR